MLLLHYDKETGQARLIIRNPFAEAWIMHYPRLTEDFRHVDEPHDWRLYVHRVPALPPSAGKSPTQLLNGAAWTPGPCNGSERES